MIPETDNTTDDYAAFLKRKAVTAPAVGFDADASLLPTSLFEFQRDIVTWACKRGRAAVFADCGLGKSAMQLSWAAQVSAFTGGDVLILAPLAVAAQTVREGEKFGVPVTHCRAQSDVRPGVNIANYEMLHAFDAGHFAGVVLDESSILKSYSGKVRNQIVDGFFSTPYKLACSATPAPNDFMELGNHSEFLDVMSRTEMLAMFFAHDGGDTAKWRLKGHAEGEYWKWLCSWAVTIRRPSDLGYADGTFALPPLHLHHHTVEREFTPDAGSGVLFLAEAQTLQERQRERKLSTSERVNECAALVNASGEPWLIWCNLNAEGDALERAIPGSVQVAGADAPDFKERALTDFADGRVRVLISKPSIAGHGMNFQACPNVAFVGLSDSWEEYYQAVRRCWRFGQTRPVHCHVITASSEGAVVKNIERKERDAEKMAKSMVEHMAPISRADIRGAVAETMEYRRNTAAGNGWTLHLGDCVEVAREMPAESVGYTLFSPPFDSLYTYSNSDRDMGNCKDSGEFYAHFGFLVGEMFRVTKPGRLLSFHCMNLPLSKERDGVIGVRDFRGELIRLFQSHGWIFHSEVCIWKDPVTAMQRTKALGLLHKTIRKDSAMSRQGIPDYLVTMRKPGENTEPISHTKEEFPVSLWQRYASPVWMDINPSKTLQKQAAREGNDERHICPLQLEVIERAVMLWSRPGDVVFDPFNGIGSTGYVALQNGRNYVGAELKPSYFDVAVGNLKAAESLGSGNLFAFDTASDDDNYQEAA